MGKVFKFRKYSKIISEPNTVQREIKRIFKNKLII